MTRRQIVLLIKHGAPEAFTRACFDAYYLGGEISYAEAVAADNRYQREWEEAGREVPLQRLRPQDGGPADRA